MCSSRVAEFLNRAKTITNTTKTVEIPKPVPNSLSTITTSPISLKKSSLSPISYQSYSSTHDESLQPATTRHLLSGPFNWKRNIAISTKEKLEKVISKSTSKEIKVKIENPKGFSKSPNHGINPNHLLIKKKEETQKKNYVSHDETQSQAKEKVKNLEITEVQQKGKKKIEKMIELFKQEALKMDQKLKQMKEQNKSLLEILANPQLPPSTKKEIKSVKTILSRLSSSVNSLKHVRILNDFCASFERITKITEENQQISNWFNSLNVDNNELSNLISSLSKKILQEQKERLKTEENTGKMIEFKENIIRELELKVSASETLARSASCRFIEDES